MQLLMPPEDCLVLGGDKLTWGLSAAVWYRSSISEGTRRSHMVSFHEKQCDFPTVNCSRNASDFSSTLMKTVPRISSLFDQHLREVRKQGLDTEKAAQGEPGGTVLQHSKQRHVHMWSQVILIKKL